jgi:hypothetical protein
MQPETTGAINTEGALHEQAAGRAPAVAPVAGP